MRRRAMAALAAATVLGACAGRDPVPVSAYKPTDAKLSCADIAAEVRGINRTMVSLARESATTSDRNVMMGAAGVLLFAPILLAIDAKDAAATENRAFEARNKHLADLARQTGCEPPVPYTVAMAEEEIGRERSPEDTASTETASASQTSNAAAPPQRSTASRSATPAAPEGDLQNLMAQFLRGEISREEYEKARMQIASN